ncbi:MAG: high-potential iron-sulfur protein [Polyangiaceae bacterium]|jgi:hypothetical protein
MDAQWSRREVIHHGIALGAAMAAAAAAACGKEKRPALSCTDTSALTPADAQVRSMLAYVDQSAQPGKMCSNCQQFLPAAPDACGACKIVKGPINPAGYCKSFLVKPA